MINKFYIVNFILYVLFNMLAVCNWHCPVSAIHSTYLFYLFLTLFLLYCVFDVDWLINKWSEKLTHKNNSTSKMRHVLWTHSLLTISVPSIFLAIVSVNIYRTVHVFHYDKTKTKVQKVKHLFKIFYHMTHVWLRQYLRAIYIKFCTRFIS